MIIQSQHEIDVYTCINNCYQENLFQFEIWIKCEMWIDYNYRCVVSL